MKGRNSNARGDSTRLNMVGYLTSHLQSRFGTLGTVCYIYLEIKLNYSSIDADNLSSFKK